MTGEQSNDRNSGYNNRINPFNVKRPHRRESLWRAFPGRVREGENYWRSRGRIIAVFTVRYSAHLALLAIQAPGRLWPVPCA